MAIFRAMIARKFSSAAVRSLRICVVGSGPAGFYTAEKGEAELILSMITFVKRIWITGKHVGFKISSRKVLQEVLSLYSVPETSFFKGCIIIDKMGKIPMEEIKKELELVDL